MILRSSIMTDAAQRKALAEQCIASGSVPTASIATDPEEAFYMRGSAGGGAALGCDAGRWSVRFHLAVDALAHYAAFDVADKETAVHVLVEHVDRG
ncbi:hypothetical protein, partial [Methylobacterium soli]|uniref:hypothetical protein n=1 Tax=Methylobacterium soli TaxID=553447 RepID=UPI00403938E1